MKNKIWQVHRLIEKIATGFFPFRPAIGGFVPTVDRRTCIAPAGLLLVGLVGCSTYQPEAPLGTEEYRQTLSVLVQVCVPTDFKRDYLHVQQVNRGGSRGDLRSAGGGGVKRRGETATGQPVFEMFTHHRPIDVIAIIAGVDGIAYTYNLPKVALRTDGWTTWQAPISQNSQEDMVWHKMANDREFKINAPIPDAPKARYRLMRNTDWWNPVFRQNDARPGC